MYNRTNLGELLSKASYEVVEYTGKIVIVRSCLNVPIENGKISDDTRLVESLPLLQFLKAQDCKVLVLGHMGRPTEYDPALSFEPIASYLSSELREEVLLVGTITREALESSDSKFFLMDNIRFQAEENSGDPAVCDTFGKQLASLGDLFINDAFADYRPSPSTYNIAKYLPAYLGPSFLKEITAFSKYSTPSHPFVAVLGGAKLSEKIDVLMSLGKFADQILIGGAMSYTFFEALGIARGDSRVEADKVPVAKEILELYGDKIQLPIDHYLVDQFVEPKTEHDFALCETQVIPEGKIAIDIGPRTLAHYVELIAGAKSIIWNGPMGVFEWGLVGNLTREIATAISSNEEADTLAGGGDSIAAINKYKVSGIDHVSTGGGAMLAYFADEKFPVLDIILDKLV